MSNVFEGVCCVTAVRGRSDGRCQSLLLRLPSHGLWQCIRRKRGGERLHSPAGTIRLFGRHSLRERAECCRGYANARLDRLQRRTAVAASNMIGTIRQSLLSSEHKRSHTPTLREQALGGGCGSHTCTSFGRQRDGYDSSVRRRARWVLWHTDGPPCHVAHYHHLAVYALGSSECVA